MISGNMVGSYSQMGKTFILQDENGNEITGVVVDQETVFDATPNDVIIGKTFASDEGVLEGTDTRTYRTTQGAKGVPVGESLSISLPDFDNYNYTQFQCIITSFNTSLKDSMAAVKISLNDKVFNVGTHDAIVDVSKNSSTKSIDLNITNDSDNIMVIYYFTYKEEG